MIHLFHMGGGRRCIGSKDVMQARLMMEQTNNTKQKCFFFFFFFYLKYGRTGGPCGQPAEQQFVTCSTHFHRAFHGFCGCFSMSIQPFSFHRHIVLVGFPGNIQMLHNDRN